MSRSMTPINRGENIAKLFYNKFTMGVRNQFIEVHKHIQEIDLFKYFFTFKLNDSSRDFIKLWYIVRK